LRNYARHTPDCWDGNWEQAGFHSEKGKSVFHPILDELSQQIPGMGYPVKRSTGAPASFSLPLPVELYLFLTDSHHYHIGCFQHPDDSLQEALDRIVTRCIPYLVSRGITLDLGCGIGGTTSLLADHAFPVLGVDPGRQQVHFATRTLRPRRNMAFAVLGLQDLLSYRKKIANFFDNIIATEILQFFPSLEQFFQGCRRFLRPEGVLIINDFATIPDLPWGKVPYHRHGAIRSAAEAAGLHVEEQQEMTSRVEPTLDRLIDEMNEKQEPYILRFGNSHPDAVEAMHEHIFQWEQVRRGFGFGDLIYESTVIRLPGEYPANE
jgi:cyclopropane fatty-acyl-phospholipid synthase-like methyltransferase